MDTETTVGTTLLSGIVATVLTFVGKLIGSRKERAEAAALEADAAARLADGFADMAEAAREDTKSMRAERDLAFSERDSCKDSLRKMDARLTAIEGVKAHHDTVCGPRIEALEGEVALSKRMLADYMRTGSTPPPSMMHTPAEVRAAMARQEETGP